MSITCCKTCNTFSGWIKRTSRRTGRDLKSTRCASHTQPFSVCDVCGVQTSWIPYYRRGGGETWDAELDTPWEFLKTGVVIPREGSQPTPSHWKMAPEQEGKQVSVYVCAPCAAALRVAMQVAFDSCMEKRAGLRAGVVLQKVVDPPIGRTL